MNKLDKALVYENILDLISNGFFLDKYIELTTESFDDDASTIDFDLSEIFDEPNDDLSIINDDSDKIQNSKKLEHQAAGIFNAIIIGCQLFDDTERIKEFVDEINRI